MESRSTIQQYSDNAVSHLELFNLWTLSVLPCLKYKLKININFNFHFKKGRGKKLTYRMIRYDIRTFNIIDISFSFFI